MKNTRVLPLLIAVLTLSLLAACGNKGELVRPAEKTDLPAAH